MPPSNAPRAQRPYTMRSSPPYLSVPPYYALLQLAPLVTWPFTCAPLTGSQRSLSYILVYTALFESGIPYLQLAPLCKAPLASTRRLALPQLALAASRANSLVPKQGFS
jgi:hypothetical protein